MKSNPSHYPVLPFHAVRAISFVSSSVVAGIMISFCYYLKNDGFKIPWTFLIILAASILTLAVLALTTFIHCCGRLSPLFNIILNVPLLILWIVGMSVLAWNIYGTLSHSCSVANWGIDRGISVCRTYKALFAFIVFGLIAHIAQLVVDVKARRRQTRSGEYAKMTPVVSEFKTEPYFGAGGAHTAASDPLVPAPHDDIPGWRPRPTGEAANYYSASYHTNRY